MNVPTLQELERVLDELVRPSLQSHGGDVVVLDFTDGVLKVQMQGTCANCPAASQDNEKLIEAEILSRYPAVRGVVLVTGVSDELIEFARTFLSKHENRH